jgi:hypothetical protein
MGVITVSINGSFDRSMRGAKSFGAMESGHAAAIGDAIAYLASLLPEAIRQDHQLHAEGATPKDGFRVRPIDNG